MKKATAHPWARFFLEVLELNEDTCKNSNHTLTTLCNHQFIYDLHQAMFFKDKKSNQTEWHHTFLSSLKKFYLHCTSFLRL